MHESFLEPLSVGLSVSERLFNFLVADDSSFGSVNKKHFAGLKSPFLDHCALVKIEHPDLGCHDNETFLGHPKTGWSKPVPVKDGTDNGAISESN